MANIYDAEECILILDLTTKAGQIAAKTFGFVMLTSDDDEEVELARRLLKELDQWDK